MEAIEDRFEDEIGRELRSAAADSWWEGFCTSNQSNQNTLEKKALRLMKWLPFPLSPAAIPSLPSEHRLFSTPHVAWQLNSPLTFNPPPPRPALVLPTAPLVLKKPVAMGGAFLVALRGCQTGLARPMWTPNPDRPGLLAHLRAAWVAATAAAVPPAAGLQVSPRELLREHGALLTRRPVAPNTETPLVPLLPVPADRLREKGQMLMLSSAPPPALLFRPLLLSFSSAFLSRPATLKMSFQRFEVEGDASEAELERQEAGGRGSGAAGDEPSGWVAGSCACSGSCSITDGDW